MADKEKQTVRELPEEDANQVPEVTLISKIKGVLFRFQSSEELKQQTQDNNSLAEIRTKLSTRRTLMAADRTLMAWVRTALSMISFGFTIYKILQGFQQGDAIVTAHQYDPQTIGLFLIGLGIFSMMLGTIEYSQTLKELRTYQHIRVLRPSLIMALVISIMGLSMFVSIIAELI